MTQAISIEKLTLSDVEDQLSLQMSTDKQFFREWQIDLPELTEFEIARVERIKAVYQNMERDIVLESSVNMAIVGPLLDAAGLFLPPFRLKTEQSVEIIAEEQGSKLRGRIDALIVENSLWILTIESKQIGFSLIVGIPQILTYMVAAPKIQQVVYGMVTNGRNFVFVKLDRGGRLTYERSQEFIIDRSGDLEQTLRIVKKLSRIAAQATVPA